MSVNFLETDRWHPNIAKVTTQIAYMIHLLTHVLLLTHLPALVSDADHNCPVKNEIVNQQHLLHCLNTVMQLLYSTSLSSKSTEAGKKLLICNYIASVWRIQWL